MAFCEAESRSGLYSAAIGFHFLGHCILNNVLYLFYVQVYTLTSSVVEEASIISSSSSLSTAIIIGLQTLSHIRPVTSLR